MDTRAIITSFIVAAATAFGVLSFSEPGKAPGASESAYDRVMRTSTLRCGYVHWEPALVIDPNTGKISGIFHDLTEEIGQRLSLKIDWAEEVGWSTAIEGIANGRYDAVCSNFWPTPARARLAAFSEAVSGSPLYFWARPDDPFIKSAPSESSLNSDETEFAYVDGTTAAQIIARRFPDARSVSYPEKTAITDMLTGLALGKGRITIMDAITVGKFLESNPGKLVRLYPDRPVAVFPNVMLLPLGDTKLKSMIDTTIRDIIYDGTFADILKRNKAQDLYLPAP